ncbi:TPR/MLP1/MLP2-like protein-domain-containing protein [Lipomyces chichibuensis]|uniref:TPR/MLP1/MLP2-like protein-domain-containing protein n=1 Tax=Lipomyces chichibuensis TaxID=1546026 RepID=UPI003344311E
MSLDERPSTASLQQRIEALEAEKRQTVEALDKKNKEIATLNEEFEGLQARYLDCRKNAVNLENKLQQAEAAKLSAKFREQNLTQEIELLKTNSKWLDNELSTKTTEFSNFRKEKSAQVSNLQCQLDSALADVSSFAKTKDTLTDRVSTLSKSLEVALQKVKALQDSSATSEENFKKEMAAQQRLAALWERSTTEARARISELEEALDAERGKETQQAASWQAIAEKERDRADEAETKLASLETELEDLHAAQERLEEQQEQQEQQRTPGTPSTPHGNGNGSLRDRSPVAMFSPSAHAITQVQKSGISLTQLYTDFMKAKHQLEHERRRNKSLQQNFDELIRDLEIRAPIIQADREEASRLKVEIADMSVLLDETEKEKEDLEKQLKASTVIVNDAEREVKIYRQQVHDLSRQVQQLLVELQSQISGAGPLSAADQAALRHIMADTSSTEMQSDTEALISERLVTFKNSIELQQQNQNLLRVTRELGDRLEREEAETRRKMEDLEAAAIREKQAKIEELEAEIKRIQTKMDSYQRERDMFRDMLSGKDGEHTLSLTAPQPATAEPESESISADEYHKTLKKHEEATKNLKELQEQFDAYRRETGVDMKMLNEQIIRLSDERASVQQELSRAQTQIELTMERLKIMADNFEMTKKENADVLKRSAQIQEILTKQDLKTQQVANEVVEVKATLETMRNENANLKAEKLLFNSIQHRMTQENESLTEEKSRLNNMISYLQSVEAEREKSDAETRRRLVSQVENLQAELNATKSKLDAETEEVRKVTMRKEYESKEFQDKIDKMLEELSSTKESLATAKASQGQLQKKADELTANLTAAEEKVTLYQRQIEEEGFSVARNLEAEVGELKATLEATRAELDEAKEHADNLSGIATAAEEALGTMNSTHDEYKSSVEEKLRSRDAEIGQLSAQVAILSKEVAETNSELSKSQEMAVERDRQFSEAKAKLDGEIQHLSDSETRLLSNVQILQSDLRKQAQITHESQNNYEAELVKHAATAQELQKLRNSHKMTVDLVHQLRNDADIAKNALDNGQTSWELRRAGYEVEIENIKSRCDDLLEQNKLLHNQFESISSQVNREQKRRQGATSVSATESESADVTEGTETTEATPASALSVGDGNSVDDMREIVKFLRHEKEIVDCQYELALQETKRLKQRLDHAIASLDEVREQLAQERENNSSTREQNLLHQELLDKVNELNILRESNSSLREENRRANNRIRNLEDGIKKLEVQIQPLEDKLAGATADLEAKEQQLKLIKEDNERWKNRAQHILQKELILSSSRTLRMRWRR